MDWLAELPKLFSLAVERVCDQDVGVIFSAGVDSTLVAYVAAKYVGVTAYAVGIEGSRDFEYAARVEDEAPFKIKYITLSQQDIEELVPGIVSLTGSRNPLDVGVGIPFHCASKACAKDGHKVMLCGQGGDELFGGYWRYLECMVADGPDAVAAWMEKDWLNAWENNLTRDTVLVSKNGLELRFPYLDEDFSDYVRGLPLGLKIRENDELPCDRVGERCFVRKYALKKLALSMGVPDYIVNRLKKAAQYGSGTQKTLDKIARTKGYKLKARKAGRKDYLQMYLECLPSDKKGSGSY